MHPLIFTINKVLSMWKEQYDPLNLVSFEFVIIGRTICFKNGSKHYPLCEGFLNLEILSGDMNAEEIQIFFNQNRSIIISIEWPDDEPPVISSVSFVYLLSEPYPAEYFIPTEGEPNDE